MACALSDSPVFAACVLSASYSLEYLHVSKESLAIGMIQGTQETGLVPEMNMVTDNIGRHC